MVGHVLKRGPRHDLEKRTVERRREVQMEVIEVPAGSHDLKKLFKRTAPFRQSSFVGRQVARDDVRKTWDQREMLAAAEIILRIDPGRVLAKVGDSTRHPFELGHAQGCASVATIAIDLRIDEIAP